MTPVVVDASAFAAVVFQEPGFEQVVSRLEGKTVYAPHLLVFELASVAVKKAKRHPSLAGRIFSALAIAFDDRNELVWHHVHASDVALLARATGTTAYDASYLWLAGLLGADLITLDARLVAASRQTVLAD
jgi:predicted nucleic acid-binding protein